MQKSEGGRPGVQLSRETAINTISILAGAGAGTVQLFATPDKPNQRTIQPEPNPPGSYCAIRPNDPSCITQTPVSFGFDHAGLSLAWALGMTVITNVVCRFFPWPTPKSNENR